jgi:hypothetical protein
MATLPISLIDGEILTDALATYYTVPASTRKVLVTNVTVVNHDSVARTVDVHFVPNGGTAGDDNARFKTLTIQPASGGDPPPFFSIGKVMSAGDFIQAKGSVTGMVALMINGIEYT